MRRRASVLIGLGIVISAVAAAAAVAQMGGRQSPDVQPGDVVPPQRGMTRPSGDRYPVTIHEYADEDKDIVTGRWITYSFPPRYYVGLLPKPNEAALRFSIMFDLETGAPWGSVPESIRYAHPSTDEGKEKNRREIVASISTRFGGFPTSEHLKSAKARGVVDITDIPNLSKSCFGDYRWIGKEICGWEMFEQCGRHNPVARAKQVYPFNNASIFGKPDGTGEYSRIVECNQTSENGWCWASEPHPVAGRLFVYFGGHHLCRAEDAVSYAKDLVGNYILDGKLELE